MSVLASMGVVVREQTVVGGAQGAGSAGRLVRMVLTLPKALAIQASFHRENWTHALIKVWKKELQAGEPAFDKLVYIETDTEDATRVFVSNPQVRSALMLLIQHGGAFEIDGSQVVAHVVTSGTEDDISIVTLVRTLLGVQAIPSIPPGRRASTFDPTRSR